MRLQPKSQERIRQHSGDDVVTHQGEPAAPVVHSPDGPRLEPIEDTESDRAGHTGRQPERHAEKCDPDPGQFVDHDVARVDLLLRRQLCGAHLADRDDENDQHRLRHEPGLREEERCPAGECGHGRRPARKQADSPDGGNGAKGGRHEAYPDFASSSLASPRYIQATDQRMYTSRFSPYR